MIYPYDTILFSNHKEWSSDAWYNIDGPWKNYAKWKKPATEDQILYDSVYAKCPE